jgi:RNA polymerase sigma-70 factor (ECF subfamily)
MPEAITIHEQFMEAYESHADAIFKHCYFRLFNRERAKEIMQDTFMRTWEQLQKGTEIKNIKAFLYRIATNLIIDDTRKKKMLSLDVLQDQGFNPSVSNTDTIFNKLDGAKVREMLQHMDPKYGEIIMLRYVEDMTVKEIAELLGLSQNVVSVRIHRGLKELKKITHY